MKNYKNITGCRICGNKNLIKVISLGDLCLTGIFPRSESAEVLRGPVDVVKCNESSGCGLVQLEQTYNAGAMYGENYGYRSGLNKSMVQHLHRKVEKIKACGILEDGDTIIDIGSNDSTTLKAYGSDKYRLVGIDPSGEKFRSYYPPEIQLIPDFFSESTIKTALKGQKAKVITSFSMFYDLEDPVAFADEIEKSLQDDGVWVLEQSYLPSMLATNSFDTICHEHLEYYAYKQIDWICKKVGLKILDVEFNLVNGGSFSLVVAKERSKRQPNYSQIEKVKVDELNAGISEIQEYQDFDHRIKNCRNQLIDFVQSESSTGKTIYGLGASTKGNVVLQYCSIKSTIIKAVGEVNSEKYGSFTPGTLIPIIPEKEVLDLEPDYLLVLPWHFREFFLNSEKFKGRNLVFPLPRIEVVRI